MGWQPLPEDAPLDSEQLAPPQAMGGNEAAPPAADEPAPKGFVELPQDAPLDSREEQTSEEAPIIISALRPGASPRGPAGLKNAADETLKAQEIDPRVTVSGFEVQGDRQYHTGLTKDDKQEYAAFFKDPKKPPSAAMLRQWYHSKTGALLGNADQIVDHFRKTGKFQTGEYIAMPKPKTTAADAYFDHTANAVTFDYGPEVAAGLSAVGLGGDGPNIWNSDDQSLFDLWANNADLLHTRLDAENEDHGTASILGELSGVALETPIAARALGAIPGMAKLAEVAGEGVRGTVQTMAEGAAYGSGAAGPGNRGEGAAIGGTLAPMVSTVAKLPVAAVDAGKTVLSGSPGLARRIVAKAIKSDENTPADVASEMASAHANDVPYMIADSGENARGLLAAATRTSGPARTLARDALETRQSGLIERVTNAIERDLGPVSNPHEVADNLMTEAKATAAPLYRRAYNRPVPDAFLEKLKPLLQRPSIQKALGNARKIAQEEGEDPDAIGLVVRDGETVIGAAPTWKTLDYIKRGMDDVVEGYRDPTSGKLVLNTEGRAVNNTLRSYISAMDVANPEYAAARAAYAGPVSGISAMNAGRKALGMTADDLEARMRDMTPFQKDMFALGARRAMAEAIAARGDSANVINTITGTGKKRAMLARLFGDRKTYQRFVETLGQEKEGFRTYARAIHGSSTALNLEDDATLKFAAAAADMAANGGIPIATAVRQLVKFGIGKVGDKTKQQVAALLSESDPARFRELADMLREEAIRRGLFKRKVNVVTGGVGKAAVAASAGPQPE